MTFDDEIKLIKITYVKNSMGDMVPKEVERNVLASKLDYRSKDYYQAMAEGLKPSITFGINKFEYEEEKELSYEDAKYKIIDVTPIKAKYSNEFEAVALICEGLVNK